MPSGRFNIRATVERATVTRDTDGGVIETWATLLKRWMSLTDHRGREFFLAAQVQADLAEIVVAPFDAELAAVTPKDRIAFNGRTLNIVSVENRNLSNREIVFRCKEPV